MVGSRLDRVSCRQGSNVVSGCCTTSWSVRHAVFSLISAGSHEWLTIGWMTIEAVVAIAAGVTASSLVLLAFGGTIVFSSWTACYRLGGLQRDVGALQSSPRWSRVVRAVPWIDCGLDFCVFCHLGIDANPAAILDLAVRDLSLPARDRYTRRCCDRMARVTRSHCLVPSPHLRVGI